MKGMYDITAPLYGAIGDGTTDDAPSIQRAVFDATRTGGIVWVPPGRYRVASPIVISGGQAIIMGAAWAGLPPAGSWLFVDAPNFSPITIDPSGRGSVVRDIAFGRDCRMSVAARRTRTI